MITSMITFTHYVNYNKFLPEERINFYLNSRGYSIVSIMKLLKNEFGYKNSEEITKELGLKNGVLRIKFAYKDNFEYADLVKKLSEAIKDLKQSRVDSDRYSHFKWRILCDFELENYLTTTIVWEKLNDIVDETFNNLP